MCEKYYVLLNFLFIAFYIFSHLVAYYRGMYHTFPLGRWVRGWVFFLLDFVSVLEDAYILLIFIFPKSVTYLSTEDHYTSFKCRPHSGLVEWVIYTLTGLLRTTTPHSSVGSTVA